MEAIEGKGKKGLIKKTYETCKSIASGMGNKKGSSSNDDPRTHAMKRKSKSWPRLSSSSSAPSLSFRQGSKNDTNKCKVVVPQGCFSVYVGEQKQRFVMKTRYLNHPLFKMLLEEAESEYGFNSSEGPLTLPCDVHLFVKVLAEMDSEEIVHHLGCSSFARSPISYHPLTPSRLVAINQF